MREINTIKFIKKIFIHKNFSAVFFTSLLSFLLILLIGLGLAWYNRAQIFGYFAKEYLRDTNDQNADNKDDIKNTAERILEKQTIFSQEHFVVNAVKKNKSGSCFNNYLQRSSQI